MQFSHVCRVRRVLVGACGDLGKVVHLDHGGYQSDRLLDECIDLIRVQAGAVFDAVDAGGDEVIERVTAEHVRGDPRTGVVRGGDRRVELGAGPQRREIAYLAVDPVADELHPPVTRGGLACHLGG